jgi:hypothetical protein
MTKEHKGTKTVNYRAIHYYRPECLSLESRDNIMKKERKHETCKDCAIYIKYVEETYITTERVAAMLGVSVKTITHWQNRTEDPLIVDLRLGKGKPNLFHPLTVSRWGIRQAKRKAGIPVWI